MPKKRQTSIILLLATAVALLVGGSLLFFGASARPLLIDVNGARISQRGRFETVGQALEAAGLELREQDFVWPDPDSAPPAGGSVAVSLASPVTLTIDGQSETRWTQQHNLASFLAEQDIGLKPTSSISVDGRKVPWPAGASTLSGVQLGQSVQVSSQVSALVDNDQEEIALQTGEATTVGQLLIEAGIEVYTADDVEPPLNSWLRPKQRIVIERAAPVAVTLDGRELLARTGSRDVAGVLAELGVGLSGRDETSPGLDQPISGDHRITIARAKSTYEIMESSLPFTSQLVPLDTLEIDQRSLVSAGSPGTLSELKRVDVIGSEVISQTTIGEWVSRPPVDEVVGYGTNVVVRTLDTPEGPISYWRVVRMRVTAYTAADAGKPPSHPAYGITASGRPAGYGIVAIDPNVVPFRSQVYVPGYGIAFAGDTGGGVKGRWIDLGYDEGQIETWNGYVDVYYLTPVPAPDRINYLIPMTLP